MMINEDDLRRYLNTIDNIGQVTVPVFGFCATFLGFAIYHSFDDPVLALLDAVFALVLYLGWMFARWCWWRRSSRNQPFVVRPFTIRFNIGDIMVLTMIGAGIGAIFARQFTLAIMLMALAMALGIYTAGFWRLH